MSKKATPRAQAKKTVAAKSGASSPSTSPSGISEGTPLAIATEAVAEPETPPLGTCANCPRQAVVRTNFSWASAVEYCPRCLPPHWRHLLSG